MCVLVVVAADFPEHRMSFFKLLRAINASAFPALLRFNGAQFQLVMDSVLWAMKHLERNIADTGLNILLELIKNVATSEVANDFFKTYFTRSSALRCAAVLPRCCVGVVSLIALV